MDDKHLTGKQLVMVSGAGLIVSLIIHLITVLNIYLVPNIIIIILSFGVLFAWFQSSRQIKIFQDKKDVQNPWRYAWGLCPSRIKYIVYFFVLYAIVNFAVSLEPDQSQGYINTSVSQAKLRGISGFWLAFYMFGIGIGYAALQRDKNQSMKTND